MAEGTSPEGGCLCGAVRYRVTAEPFARSICHCRSCRLASGAPSVAWAVFRPEDFSFTHGEPLRFESSPDVIRTFCGRCGTPLTWREADDPRLIDISIASLDKPDAVAPTRHVWTDSRIPWFETADHLPRYPRNERPATDR